MLLPEQTHFKHKSENVIVKKVNQNPLLFISLELN